MISSLHVKNFKCLRDVHVEFGPLTVLIGPNDSGKTSLMEAIESLGQTVLGNLGQIFTGPTSLLQLVWRGDGNGAVGWRVTGRALQIPFEYALQLDPRTANEVVESLRFNGRDAWSGLPGPEFTVQVGTPQVRVGRQPGVSALSAASNALGSAVAPVGKALRSTTKYRLDPDALRKPAPSANNPVLTARGDNLAAVLDAMISGPNRDTVRELETALRQAVPTLQGISLPVVHPPQKALAFTLAGSAARREVIPANLASDGALLVTAFLALAYGDTPDILLIEEPENGLHPFLLKHVVDLLRKISTGEVGDRPRQVILTTHSPILLNFVDPAEVRIFSRRPGEGARVTPMQEVPNIDNLLKEFATGELWYLLGEEALVEGKQA